MERSVAYAILPIVIAYLTLATSGEIGSTCPSKCKCQGYTSVTCTGLHETELKELFSRVSSGAYANALQNLTVVESDLRDLLLLPQLPSLLHLDLSDNNISALATAQDISWPSVRVLILNGNQLTSILRNSFVHFAGVEELQIQRNRLFTVEWEAFRLFKLRKLYLSQNYILTISEHMLRLAPSIELLDLSHNQLASAQSSSFFSARKLVHLNLSHNRIQRFDYDSFSPLYQLETLDMSFNNLSVIPSDLRQLVGLRVLDLGGNPLTKIEAGDLVQPLLQELRISNSPSLRLVEAFAFSRLPNLQVAKVSHNPQLVYISPAAFTNDSLLFEVDLSANALTDVNEAVVKATTRLRISGNLLNCGCIRDVVRNLKSTIADIQQTYCTSSVGEKLLLDTFFSSSSMQKETCPMQPLLPFGTELVASVGEYFAAYCTSRDPSTAWTLSNGTELTTREFATPWPTSSQEIHWPMFDEVFRTGASSPVIGGIPQFSLDRYAGPQSSLSHTKHPRLTVSKEKIQFEALTAEDAGEYVCKAPASGMTKKFRLQVVKPSIALYPLEVGSHYVTLAWNDSLNIRAFDKVKLSLCVKDSHGSTTRSIQLSLHNPWYSYNVMRLKAVQNYTFCLDYRITDASGEKLMFESCVTLQTLPTSSIWNSLNFTTILVLVFLFIVVCGLLCARTIFLRFYIWQQTKCRARMNQSISGQSFLSSRSTFRNDHSLSRSITYENTSQILSQSTTMNRLSVLSTCDEEPSKDLLMADAAV